MPVAGAGDRSLGQSRAADHPRPTTPRPMPAPLRHTPPASSPAAPGTVPVPMNQRAPTPVAAGTACRSAGRGTPVPGPDANPPGVRARKGPLGHAPHPGRRRPARAWGRGHLLGKRLIRQPHLHGTGLFDRHPPPCGVDLEAQPPRGTAHDAQPHSGDRAAQSAMAAPQHNPGSTCGAVSPQGQELRPRDARPGWSQPGRC